MPQHASLFPEQASEAAASVDAVYFYLLVVGGLMAITLAVLVIAFAVKYHRRSAREVPVQSPGNFKVEIGWTVGTLILFLTMFFWSASVYFGMKAAPVNAMEIYAVGKQWMWKIQHAGGQREINELHIPVGTPIRVTLASQDVIHSFFIPAFRVKQDAVPGRYTSLWFTPNKPGKYHLFCAEFCGIQHYNMIGYVYAMEPHDFAAWLSAGGAEGSLVSEGEKLFHQFGCNVCHDLEGGGPGPNLRDVYRSPVRLDDGSTVVADEAYIRESILQPDKKIVYGHKSIMPTFQGQVSDEQLIRLVAYIRALSNESAPLNGATGSNESKR